MTVAAEKNDDDDDVEEGGTSVFGIVDVVGCRVSELDTVRVTDKVASSRR